MGAKTVAAGLLHDTVEDVGVESETIEKEFGKEVRFLVDGVTKLGQLKYRGTGRHRESLRKLLVATGKDARVLIIKLIDRLHNMRTLQHVQKEKRERIALETLEIYADIAHRLGMGVVRRELEDLAFEYAYPEDFTKTKKLLSERTKETQVRLEAMARTLRKKLAEDGIVKFESDHRVKGLWSLYQKLKRKGGDISEIHDIAALRVVVETVPDCYRALGIVNNLWQPLVGKIKDYIAFPKPNGYQSLHTAVFSGDGGIVEIQIRTKDMHLEAMYGIAAHVTYKEPGVAAGRGSSFDWIKSLIPGFGRRTLPEQETKEKTLPQPAVRYGSPSAPEGLAHLNQAKNDQPDFDTILKSVLFALRVFVFTPKGDVVDLPVKASPVDFAYAIHSDLGDHVFGVKVNGKMVSLNTVLHNCDIAEIDTRKSAHPTKKWLDFAKTTLARRHIRNAIGEGVKN